MIQDLRILVEQIAALTGAAPPCLLEDDAPTLSHLALDEPAQSMYLVGLIGGKEVGKSALVNALVGQEITDRTSHGPGTESVIAYAHEDQVSHLRELLEREAPGQHRIVAHRIRHLSRQVLLDLPDIDSHYVSHIELTRRMLRHMLFPIWIQSIEKYADRQPRELLARVAAGNSPQNFIFCLNKADQLFAREGPDAAEDLRRDFASRIAGALQLPHPPRVWLISAVHPERYDLPELRSIFDEQRSHESVDRSRRHAVGRQGLSLAQWIDTQNLTQRLDALQRLETAAEAEVSARLALPLVDRVIPRLVEDPAYRLALGDQLMQKRIARWPIVNILHVLLGPLLTLLRARLPVQQQLGLAGADDLVAQHLAAADAGGRTLASAVEAAFASLHQTSPQVGRLYGHQKLWEPPMAQQAEADLRRRLAAAIDAQREQLRQRFRSGGALSWFFRVLLTIGALFWFPIIQPLLEAWVGGARQMILLAVSIFGATYLLKSAGFLAVYYLALWLIIKWDTQRRVDNCVGRWKTHDTDPNLSLPAQVLEWTAALLDPIHRARRQLADLAHRADELRQALPGEAA